MLVSDCCSQTIQKWLSASNEKPFIIGLQGCQGSGKTTLCMELETYFTNKGLKIAVCSIDDFYYARDTMQKNYEVKFQKLEMYKERGLPGTHDVELLRDVLESVKQGKEGVRIPSYDKSLHNGLGDRGETWHTISGKLDIFILEGWCIGYLCKNNDDILDNQIALLNKLLPYYDAFIELHVNNIEVVYQWRSEQEKDTIKRKGNGMSDLQVKLFVDKFMPIYTNYADHIFQHPNNNLIIHLNNERRLINYDTQ